MHGGMLLTSRKPRSDHLRFSNQAANNDLSNRSNVRTHNHINQWRSYGTLRLGS